MKSGNRTAFALIDLYVVSAVLTLTIAMMSSSIGRAQEQANRVKCASNLRQIGQAMAMYANAETTNANSYPRTSYVPDAPLTGTDASATTPSPGYNQVNSFAEAGKPSPVGDNNVMASFFLLQKTQDLSPKVFNCPTGGTTPDPFAASPNGPVVYLCWDAPANRYLSYSMQVPFPSKSAVTAGFKWNAATAPDFATAADINPGTPALQTVTPSTPRAQMIAANSPNHDWDGQNVLYGDGHVEWFTSPFAGASRSVGGSVYQDNIYTYGMGATQGIIGPPQDELDSILLPVAGTGLIPPKSTAFDRNPLLFILLYAGAGLLVVAAIVLVLYFALRRPSHTPPPLPPTPMG